MLIQFFWELILGTFDWLPDWKWFTKGKQLQICCNYHRLDKMKSAYKKNLAILDEVLFVSGIHEIPGTALSCSFFLLYHVFFLHFHNIFSYSNLIIIWLWNSSGYLITLKFWLCPHFINTEWNNRVAVSGCLQLSNNFFKNNFCQI